MVYIEIDRSMKYKLADYWKSLMLLQVDDSKVEEKDIELVMQQANVSRSKVSTHLLAPVQCP